MSNRENLTGWVAPLVAIALLLLLPALYVGGYFLSGNYHQNFTRTVVIRSYDFTWEKSLFRPAGKVEESLTGREVLLTTKRP